MVAGANGDALAIQDLRDVVRMSAFDRERNDRAFVRRLAVEFHPVQPAQRIHGAIPERRFVRFDGSHGPDR